MPKGIPNKRYTPEFKKLVVETMRNERLPVHEVMKRFTINDHKIIERWERIYLEEGPEGLAMERRGIKERPCKLPKEAEEDLIAEVQRLRIVAGGGFSVFYAIFERFEPIWPQLAEMPLAAALLGAVFVGVGVGLSVRAGGAPGGDDALAMSVSHMLHCKIEVVYLVSDLVVLVLSVSYIPFRRLLYSLLTVILSGQIIGIVQRLDKPGKKQKCRKIKGTE